MSSFKINNKIEHKIKFLIVVFIIINFGLLMRKFYLDILIFEFVI